MYDGEHEEPPPKVSVASLPKGSARVVPALNLPRKSSVSSLGDSSPSESPSDDKKEPAVEVGSLNQTVIKADLDSFSDSIYSGGMAMIY